jgi:hypothetical protein
MTMRDDFHNNLPPPGLPASLNDIAPKHAYVNSLMKAGVRYTSWDNVKGMWYAEVNEIARMYEKLEILLSRKYKNDKTWNGGIEIQPRINKRTGEPYATADKDLTYNVDALVMNCIQAEGKHQLLTHRQICQGMAMIRRWEAWLSEQMQGMGSETKNKSSGDCTNESDNYNESSGNNEEFWDVGLPKWEDKRKMNQTLNKEL